jgi:hypothetical protein
VEDEARSFFVCADVSLNASACTEYFDVFRFFFCPAPSLPHMPHNADSEKNMLEVEKS